MSTPPKPGKGLSVRVDETLYDDLAVMMRAGITASDAVREAVSLIAGAWRHAWESGHYPEGVMPQVTDCGLAPYDARMTAPGGRTTASDKGP
ncbi:hypothetical protein OG741_13780 [Streptomyces sp. NBC_01410]|uniref:hypothetical protein n=1 Tax=Streptomyces sp. NBC_01410 TaxID=2903856 RepID=UPI00324E04F9